MRDCPNGEIRDLLPEFVHGRLDAAAEARVREHLASCEDCEVEVGVLRSLREELEAPIAVDLAAVTAGVVAHTTTRPGASFGRPAAVPFGRATRWLRAAALVLTVGGGSLLVVRQASGPGQSVPAESESAAVLEQLPTTGMGFAGGVADLGDADLQELEAAVAALEQEPLGDAEPIGGEWGTTTRTEGQ